MKSCVGKNVRIVSIRMNAQVSRMYDNVINEFDKVIRLIKALGGTIIKYARCY